MLITRDIINKNIKFHNLILDQDDNVSLKSFNIDDLYSLIDNYKNILIANNAKPGHNAVIADSNSLSQTAFIFACSELNITITIVNNPYVMLNNRPIVSEELRHLLPITFLIGKKDGTGTPNVKSIGSVATKYIITDNCVSDFNKNTDILAKAGSSFLKCYDRSLYRKSTQIYHSHEFIYSLSKRNSKSFNGKVAMLRNLNHGSSMATYFLPSLMSDDVTDLYHLQINSDKPNFWKNETYNKFCKFNIDLDFNHVLFPYNSLVDDFFNGDINLQNCCLYTLGPIKSEYKEYLNAKFKNMISIFGTSSISGPVFVNELNNNDFTPSTYKLVDDFYKVNLDNNHLSVGMPFYDRTILTEDVFEQIDNTTYKYLGTDKNLPKRE